MMAQRFGWLKVRDRRSFLLMTSVMALAYMATGTWSPLMAVYVESLGAQTSQIGLVLATWQATSLASQYWWGRRSDRLGRRKPLLLVGTACLGLSYLLIASASSYVWLFAIRVLEGIALAAYQTGSLALVGDLLEDQANRGRLMGIYRMVGSLAFSVAALSGGIVADAFGIRVPFLVAASCYALAFVLIIQIRERPPAPEQPQPAAVPLPDQGAALPEDPLARRALWPFLALVFTWMFGMGAVVQFWPVYMSDLGYSKTAVGGLWALAALGEAPWMIVAGGVADRWGRKWAMLIGVSCMAFVFFGYTLSAVLIWLIGVQMLRSFAYAHYEAPALVYATELGLRRQRGRLAGLYYSASGVGGIAGTTLGGAVAQQVGLSTMYRGVVVIMLLIVVVVALTMPRLRHASGAAEAALAPRPRRS